MAKVPGVSIILPTYNRAHLLPRAIQSVINQIYQDWELIIWDDGSTDDSSKVIGRFQDDRIQYYFGENHGAAFARNRAVEKSTGHYLAFVDSDDEWDSKLVNLQVRALQSHPEIDIVFTDFVNIHEKEGEIHHTFSDYRKVINKTYRQKIDEDLYLIRDGFLASISMDNYIALDTVLLRKTTFDRAGGFCEELWNGHDFELWWRLALDGKQYALLDKELIIRFKPAGSLSSLGVKNTQNHLLALDKCMSDAIHAGHPEYIEFLKGDYRNTWQLMMAHYGQQGDLPAMASALRKSLSYGFRPGTIRLLISSLVTGLRSNRRKA